jgi:hypothetical protein
MNHEVSISLIILLFLSTSLTLYFYFKVALTNPGYILGSEADVEKRAGAYNPKHYQVNSDRKVSENFE